MKKLFRHVGELEHTTDTLLSYHFSKDWCRFVLQLSKSQYYLRFCWFEPTEHMIKNGIKCRHNVYFRVIKETDEPTMKVDWCDNQPDYVWKTIYNNRLSLCIN